MKRHISLVPLSREHHGALILARLLQKGAPAYKGLPTDIAGKAAYARLYYEEEIDKHFSLEERSLLIHAKGINAVLDKQLDAMKQQHQQLRLLFHAIHGNEKQEDRLDELGHALENHIRMEERELFPLIQDTCIEEVMKQILQSLTASL